MSEYIDKSKLVDRFDELCNTICQYSKKQRAVMCSSCELGIAFDVVDEFPVEDVQPVKHGRWINTMPNVEYKSFCQVKCSICESIEAYGNFCRNCGADMRGE